MRLLEVFLILVILAVAGVTIFIKKNRRLDARMFLLLGLVVLLHGIIDHFRLQMVLAYVTALLLMLVLIRRMMKLDDKPKSETRKKSILKKGFLSILIIKIIGSSVYLSRQILPIFTMPEPTGSYAIGTISVHLKDESRDEPLSDNMDDKRELMINLWYPVDQDEVKGKPVEHYPSELGEALSLVFQLPKKLFNHLTDIPTHVVEGVKLSEAKSKYPILLFSPGVRSTRFQSLTTIEELVSHGYIVVGMDHPYTSAKVTFPDGHAIFYKPDPPKLTSAELYKHNVKGVGIRVKDAQFVLDTLSEWNMEDPNGMFKGKLDLERVGIFGHSYGGATTAEALAQDKRFKAGVSLEGGFWGNVAQNGLTQPFMYLMSGKTATIIDPSTEEEDDLVYEEFTSELETVMTKSTSDTYYLTVKHFFHQSFADIALISPTFFAKGIEPFHNIDITRSYVRAFFDQYLKGKHSELLDGPSPRYPEVMFDEGYTKKRIDSN